MQIVLGHTTVDDALAAVGGAVAELAETRTSAARQVGLLLDGSWAGAAAASFDEAWQDWLAGEEEVREALGALRDALAATRRDLTATDTATAAGLDRLHGRLGG
ncbi:WXG100 family type VII secretion target [Nocardioides coralli]|uniref:WXG100 family type VII secretion target n=1 Tax=Nocardioides coralli TaxID=2872154 RepID=UPI001CA3EEE6|nr:WXG100 family type VII secretion target [Nocardioides coralli]QZY29726.1 WXG100 family type VII secretion target [Nocardioides coralli]